MDKKIELTPNEFGKVNEIVTRFAHEGDVREEPTLVIVMGPIASGKTTRRRQLYGKGFVLVDSGELFDAFRSGEENQEKLEGLLMVAGTELVRRSVTERRNIVIEVSADTPEKGEKVKKIADTMTGLGYKVSIDYVECDPEECQRRNEKGRDNVSSYYSTEETMHYFFIYFENR